MDRHVGLCGPVWLILLCMIQQMSCASNDGQPLSSGPRLTHIPTSQYARLGDNITFLCEAYFGGDDMDTGVFWRGDEPYAVNSTSMVPSRVLTANSRYIEEKYDRDNRALIGSNLTILDLRSQDYNKSLHCFVKSGAPRRKVNPLPRTFTVRVLPYVEERVVEKPEMDLSILIPVLLGIALIISLIILTWYKLGPQINFCYSSLVGNIGSNTNYEYDVMVVHDHDDASFVIEHVRPKLKEDLGYKTFIVGEDIASFQQVYEQGREAMDNSFSLMFVVTPGVVDDVSFSNLMCVAINLRRIIILLEVHKEGKSALDWKELKRSKGTDQYHTLIKGLRYLTTVKWPGDKASTRELDKFWYQIRKKLPKLEKLKKENVSASLERHELVSNGNRKSDAMIGSFECSHDNGLDQYLLKADIESVTVVIESDPASPRGDDLCQPHGDCSNPYTKGKDIPDRRLAEIRSNGCRIPTKQSSMASTDSGSEILPPVLL